jgi:hypothetical protein
VRQGHLLPGKREDPDNPGEELIYYVAVPRTKAVVRDFPQKWRVSEVVEGWSAEDADTQIAAKIDVDDEDLVHLSRNRVSQRVQLPKRDLVITQS